MKKFKKRPFRPAERKLKRLVKGILKYLKQVQAILNKEGIGNVTSDTKQAANEKEWWIQWMKEQEKIIHGGRL